MLEYAKKLKVKAQTDYIMMARADLDTENLANRLSIEETEELFKETIDNPEQFELYSLEGQNKEMVYPPKVKVKK